VNAFALPDGAYLAWWYADPGPGGHHGRVYWNSGRVESTDGELCRFGDEQLAAAKAAVLDLDGASASEAGEDGFDTASVVYAWSVAGHRGRLTYQYPPEPTAIQALERRLTELEEDVGGWPLLADE
jgi:hypothetical protein